MNNDTELYTTIQMWRPSTSDLPQVQKNSDDTFRYWGLRQQYLTKDWRRRLDSMVVRKKKNKSVIDSILRDTLPQPPKHLGVAWEGRTGRVIITLDMKHAYPFAVAHCAWADPKTLEYVTSTQAQPTNKDIVGVYRIRLTKQIMECVPPISIKSACGRVISVMMGTPCELWIHSCEWDWWTSHFEFDILHGVEGKSQPHPLHHVAHKLYAQYETTRDPNIKKMMRMLHTAMGSRSDKENNREYKILWSLLLAPLYFIRSQWLNKWSELQKRYPSALLCYANVDSMHWSIKKEEWESSPYTQDESLQWGSWRLEYIAQKGLWLATGKYWLVDDKNVITFPHFMGRIWTTKKRVRSHQKYVSLYLWHGIIQANKMFREEDNLIKYVIPTNQQAQDIETMQKWFIRSAKVDRQWKKKLWFNFKRGYYEKTQIS